MRTKETTHKIMSAIKSQDTSPEVKLGKILWAEGIRYRKHYKVIGKPDFAIVSKKIAIFCDGDFWHGNNWRIRGFRDLKAEISTYSDYWSGKILKNIERDKKVNNKLKSEGWHVIRIWESDIKKNPKKVTIRIIKEILRKK